jgi:hypothetical protein
MKTCSKCKQTKSLNQFHIDKTTKDGHRADCKECRSKKKIIIKKLVRTKQCNRCNQLKPLSAFRPHSTSKDKRRHVCKSCDNTTTFNTPKNPKPKKYNKTLTHAYMDYLCKL